MSSVFFVVVLIFYYGETQIRIVQHKSKLNFLILFAIILYRVSMFKCTLNFFCYLVIVEKFMSIILIYVEGGEHHKKQVMIGWMKCM